MKERKIDRNKERKNTIIKSHCPVFISTINIIKKQRNSGDNKEPFVQHTDTKNSRVKPNTCGQPIIIINNNINECTTIITIIIILSRVETDTRGKSNS